ncbi:MAG TPA: hypothetical protein VM784_15060, partial [Actinomycetota bacterium]|nr:hypothetical protein [Actinomycetota bacterium]
MGGKGAEVTEAMGTPIGQRYCPECRAEVEASDGYCLLGHRLALAPPTSIAALRSEVDRVFDEVRTTFESSFSIVADDPPQ